MVRSIPNGKNILEFLQELDEDRTLPKDAWHFLHADVVKELILQAGPKEISPAFTLVHGDCSFALHYSPSSQYIGSIALHSLPCYDECHHSLWFLLCELYLFENSPIQIAFHTLSPISTEAIFLILEK